MTAKPLDGLKVVDTATLLAGPLIATLLGDYGADVVKVEHPKGDALRSFGWVKDGVSLWWLFVNRNKACVSLALSDPAGAAVLKELVADADVLVENFRPGTMERWGLGWDDLRAVNPRLVMVRVTGFGQTGPYSARPGYGTLAESMSGFAHLNGYPDGPPTLPPLALADGVAACVGAFATVAALRHRDATGEGQRIEVDLLSALLAGLVNQGSAYTIAGVVPGRLGNAHPSISPYELYPTGEGELVVAVGNERQFAALCEVIGAPELAADPRFATNNDRVHNREALRATLVERLATRGGEDWAARLRSVRVPAGVVNDLRGAFALAQSLGLEPIVEVPAGDGASVPLTRNPIRLSRTPPSYRSAPEALPDR